MKDFLIFSTQTTRKSVRPQTCIALRLNKRDQYNTANLKLFYVHLNQSFETRVYNSKKYLHNDLLNITQKIFGRSFMNMVYNILHFDWWNRMSAWKSCRGSNCREVSLSCRKDEDELMAEEQFFPVLQELNAKFFRTKKSHTKAFFYFHHFHVILQSECADGLHQIKSDLNVNTRM